MPNREETLFGVFDGLQNHPLRMGTSASAGNHESVEPMVSFERPPRSEVVGSAMGLGITLHSVSRALPCSLPTQRASSPPMPMTMSGLSLRIRSYHLA